MATAYIKIKNLDRNGLQTRVALNEQTVEEYTEAMDAGMEFPPVTVFRDNEGVYRLADGFHRVEAKTRTKNYSKPGFDTVKANIINGGYAEALKYALSANSNHGLRRTNADKNRAVNIALTNCKRLFGGVPTASVLAGVCAVSIEFANRLLLQFEAENEAPKRPVTSAPVRGKAAQSAPPVRTRIGKGGKVITLPPVRVARPGYYIGKDGNEHAIGVSIDRYGVEIPERLKAVFEDARLDGWAQAISAVKCEIQAAREGQAPYSASIARAQIQLENAYHELKAAKPHCVCRMCQGNGCDACHDTGYQTEDQYKRNPKEFQA